MTSTVGSWRAKASWRIAILGLAATGCAFAGVRLPPDPGVTFAAHLVHGGLMVDEMRGGEPTLLTAPAWFRLPGRPALVIRDGSERGEGLWLNGPGQVVVRRTLAPDSPLIGRIEPSWDNNAIRITIEPAGGPRLRSDVFVREDVGAGTSTLSRLAQLSIDVYGTYRAVLRDPAGRPVGWLRVAVGLHQPAPEMYEGILPPEIDEGLAAASAATLGEEIDWIENHAYAVYRGTDRP